MKKTLALCLLLIFFYQGYSQFPVQDVMPLHVSGVSFGDTLLNTQAILQRESVKKVIANETLVSKNAHRYDKTEYEVKDGKLTSWMLCFRRSLDSGFRICTKDTLLYDATGRLKHFYAVSGSDTPWLQALYSYTEQTALHTWITKDPQTKVMDTSIYSFQYNGAGKLIRQEHVSGRLYSENVSFFYHEDGLPDSIRNDDPAKGTMVFTRKNRKDHKEIIAESTNAIFKWVYNSAGQCLSAHWSSKKNKYASGKPFSTTSVFFYNGDGTLAKVVETGNERTTTIVYTYIR